MAATVATEDALTVDDASAQAVAASLTRCPTADLLGGLSRVGGRLSRSCSNLSRVSGGLSNLPNDLCRLSGGLRCVLGYSGRLAGGLGMCDGCLKGGYGFTERLPFWNAGRATQTTSPIAA